MKNTNLQPLAGLRVLDLSKVLAGPLCAQFMADMGADVIKVEAPRKGDDTRGWPPFDDGQGAVFLSCNRNKRSISLDLKADADKKVLYELVQKADVVIESFGPGVANSLGLDWDTLTALKKNLVYCRISGFGTTGPMSDGKGYDVVLQAFGGMISITGEPGGGYVRSPFSPVDQATGLHALSGILAGLRHRDASGEPVLVEACLFDTAVSFMGYFLQGYWASGREPQRAGAGHESLCPYQAFETSDRPFVLGIANDALWKTFCELVGRPELAADPRFATNASRVENRVETIGLTQGLLSTRTRAEWIAELDAAGIPCSPIHSLSELSQHEHLHASGMVVNYEGAHPKQGIAHPLRFNGQRVTKPIAPPRLDADRESVMADLETTTGATTWK